MWPGSRRPDMDAQVTRTFGTTAGTPVIASCGPGGSQHPVLREVWVPVSETLLPSGLLLSH